MSAQACESRRFLTDYNFDAVFFKIGYTVKHRELLSFVRVLV